MKCGNKIFISLYKKIFNIKITPGSKRFGNYFGRGTGVGESIPQIYLKTKYVRGVPCEKRKENQVLFIK